MTIAIDFTPAEQARITEAADRAGVAPADLVRKITLDYLPAPALNLSERVQARFRELQAQDRITLFPPQSLEELRAKWAQEDTQMTDEERAEEARIYAEIEKNGIPRVQI